MTEPPPSRYRVVERGRRLEVIDTRGGAQRPAPAIVTSGPRRTTPPIRAVDPAGRTLNTIRLYDEKAPRSVWLDAAGVKALGRAKLVTLAVAMLWFVATIWQPFLAVLPLFLLARNGLGRSIRHRITRWLDGYDPG